MLTKEELVFVHSTLFNASWNGELWIGKVLPLLKKIEDIIKNSEGEKKIQTEVG